MIDVTRNERVAGLTINVPPVNVLGSAVLEELSACLEGLAEEPELAAVLIAGDGRCFSAGASVAEHRVGEAARMVAALGRACTAIASFPIPVVAMVHGSCLGGAMELVEACDFVVADPDATFGQPEIKLAFFPPVAAYELPRLTGRQNAAYLMLTGESIGAERAVAMGLVQKILPVDRWPEIELLFNRLSAAALRVTKKALQLGAGARDAARLAALEELFLTDLYALEDPAEGIEAFEARRRPEWKHR